MSRPEYVPIYVAALAFAAVLLGLFNWLRSKRLLKKLRNQLINRSPFSDSQLIAAFPLPKEKEFALQFRRKLSRALHIDPQKIHPDDDLQLDYHLNTICPSLLGAAAFEFTGHPAELLKYKRASSTFKDFVRAVSQESKFP